MQTPASDLTPMPPAFPFHLGNLFDSSNPRTCRGTIAMGHTRQALLQPREARTPKLAVPLWQTICVIHIHGGVKP